MILRIYILMRNGCCSEMERKGRLAELKGGEITCGQETNIEVKRNLRRSNWTIVEG